MCGAAELVSTPELGRYLCPERRISFDGFVSYEGRQFGVPYSYAGKVCRVQRDGYNVIIYDQDLTRVLTTHDVTWSRKSSMCKGQYADGQPEEQPTEPVEARIRQEDAPEREDSYKKFCFGEGLIYE